MSRGLRPRPRPCASCPYRRDTPSGIWAPEEYAKLLQFDGSTEQQAEAGAFAVFMCHQGDGHLCAGWVAVHDMDENLAVRVDREVDVLAVRCYTTDVPLFSSGAEAAAHGLADIEAAGAEALRTMAKIAVVRARRGNPVAFRGKPVKDRGDG